MGLLWGVAFHWVDLALLAACTSLCAFGTTIGFHRYFTHRGFEARAPVKATLAILGCMTMQGPITQWVTDHRKHHALSDQPGDPHSPHVGHGEGVLGRRTRLRRTPTSAGSSRTSAWSRAASTARTSTRTGSSRAIDRAVPALGRADARDPVRDRLRGGRHRSAPGSRGSSGAACPDLPLPARDLQRELDLPHVRPPGLPLARRGAEQLARRAARLRRGLAQQPPRVPRLRAPRPRPAADRPLVVGDPRARAARARLEREGARRGASASGAGSSDAAS